jgi:hypothetical protein
VFSAGVLSHYLLLGDLVRRAAGGAAGEEDTGATVERMVRYITAGLKAQRPAASGKREPAGRKGAGGRKRR